MPTDLDRRIEIGIRLEHINEQLKMSYLWAEYWITMASTGVAKMHNIRQGGSDGRQLTDDEKLQSALNTSKSHIHMMRELVDAKVGLLNELNKGGNT
jgi:hypothetical protein